MAFHDPEPRSFLTPRMSPIIDTIVSQSTMDAGLKLGDKIVAINGKPVSYYDEVKPLVVPNAGKVVDFQVLRDNQITDLKIPVSKEGTIGILSFKEAEKFMVHNEYNFFGSIKRGFTLTIESLTYQIKQFKLIFNKKYKDIKKWAVHLLL